MVALSTIGVPNQHLKVVSFVEIQHKKREELFRFIIAVVLRCPIAPLLIMSPKSLEEPYAVKEAPIRNYQIVFFGGIKLCKGRH